MVEVMKIVATSSKRSCACTAALIAPDPAAGHSRPTPPLETPGQSWQVWVSLLWGHCSFLLGPGVHEILFVPCDHHQRGPLPERKARGREEPVLTVCHGGWLTSV